MIGQLRTKPSRPLPIGEVRDLIRSDLALLRLPRAKTDVVARFRDSHHQIARMFASGMRVQEVWQRSGYSYTRISVMHTDPAFQELIASYRDKVDAAFLAGIDDYFEVLTSNKLKAERMIADKLDEAFDNNETLPVKDLIAIGRDAADRTGHGKHNTTTNVNVDFASALEKAIKRSDGAKVINVAATAADRSVGPSLPRSLPSPSPQTVDVVPPSSTVGVAVQQAPASPTQSPLAIRRRA